MQNNTIKIAQLDPAISGYIAGILESNFSTYAALFGAGTGYLGDHVLYITGGDQTIYGQKTFDVSPSLPYSGGTGQAVSRLFVTDSISGIQSALNEIAPNYLSKTGNSSISGVNNFAFLIQSPSGRFTSECLVPLPTSSSGAINLEYLSSIGVVNLSGDQMISGRKTFESPIRIPNATGTGNAVTLFQLQEATGTIASTVSSYDSRLEYLETSGGASGFAGVLSVNGQSGRMYFRGCGGISVVQEGNVTRVSGNTQGSEVETKTALIQRTPLASGSITTFVPFGSSFDTAPVVVGDVVNSNGAVLFGSYISGISTSGFFINFNSPLNSSSYVFNSIASLPDVSRGSIWQKTPLISGESSKYVQFESTFSFTPIVFGGLENNVGEPIISHILSGVNKSGFHVVFSAPVQSNNYKFNSFASSGIGTLGVNVVSIPGEQGPQGRSMVYRGEWQPNMTYAELDYVLYGQSSFLAASTHVSSTLNNPLVSRSLWNIALSGNGPTGERGPTGIQGPVGQKGDGGILFRWKGQWQPTTSYTSGDGVYLSGSAYGMTGAGSVLGTSQSPLVHNSWSLVVNGTGINTSDFYPTTSNPSGYVTESWIQTGLGNLYSSGGHQHPTYVTGLKVGTDHLSGLVFLYGAGGVTVQKVGDSIMFSGNGLGGSSANGFNWKGYWNSANVYASGDAVEYDNAAYFCVSTGGGVQGLNSNPVSLIGGNWSMFEERDLTHHNGEFDPNRIYYRNDLVHYSDAATRSSVLFVNTSSYEAPLLALNPFTNKYNSFEDCDGAIGYNLFEITTGVKAVSHPLYGSGSATGYRLNNVAVNSQASGYGTLTLIRGESYFFDSEVTGHKFILTSNSSGGSFAGEYIANCSTGRRLEADGFSFVPMAGGIGIESGTLRFTPDATTPNALYYQSALQPFMGWKINVVDSNPWAVFVSGAVGEKGDRGEAGDAGLAFVWKGEWDNATFYDPYDAVYYEGSSWGTLESVNALPPSENSPAWVLIAKKGTDGTKGEKGDPGLAFTWKGEWSSSTVYAPYSAVQLSGSSFGTTVLNTNKNPYEFTQTWQVIASGSKGENGQPGLALNWMGNWSPSVTYSAYDSVYFEGSSYGTLSTTIGTPPPSAPWFLTAQRGGTIFHWAGIWSSTNEYNAGDAVYHAGCSYATSAYSSGDLPSAGGTWFLCASSGGAGPNGQKGDPGIVWKSTWSSTTNYVSGDAVAYNGQSYICKTGHTNVLPVNSPPWDLLVKQNSSPLFNYSGSWSAGNGYKAYDMVYHNGSSWGTTSTVSAGAEPGAAGVWFPIALGTDINRIVRTSGDQDISGLKTFQKVSVTGSFSTPPQLLDTSSTIIDCSGASMFVRGLNANASLTLSNISEGQSVKVMLLNSGSHTVSWNPSTIRWGVGFSTNPTPSKGDMYEFTRMANITFGSKISSGHNLT